MTALAAALDPLLSLLYPPRCAVCGTLGSMALCPKCIESISPVADPCCARCGQTHTETGCSHCRSRQPAFECARALGAYEGILRDAIHRFKYHDRPLLAEPLGRILAEYALSFAHDLNALHFDAVIPMPMHPARRRRRGYNQSERLARVVARELSLPLAAGTLIRTKATRSQVGLAAKARRSNLQNAFAVRATVTGQMLLLIDDVMTTGSSLHECALALNLAGAKGVYALTLAVG